VKFDNLYDLLFNNAGEVKNTANKKLIINGEKLDFLESAGQNLEFSSQAESHNGVDLEKVKLSKQFKLVNPLPKFQSVPATPQFFDLAGTYVNYPDLTEPLTQYKIGGGVFKKLAGFFGRS
jgi:hypothetical protein